MKHRAWLVLTAAWVLITGACGGSGSSHNPPPPSIAVQLAASSVTAPQDGTPATVAVTVTRPAGNTNSVALSAGSIPAGVTAQANSPGTGNTGSVAFTAAASVPAGTYAVTVSATDGTISGSSNLALVVAVVAAVQSTVNTNAGVHGRLETFMSTSFQPADYNFNFFSQNPAATTPLGNLNPQHIRLQPLDGATPQKADQSWDFTELDAMVDPVLSAADKSPEFQIAVAPDFMNGPKGNLLPSNFAAFAAYCANLVKYYNTTTGFTDSTGATHVHSTSTTTLTPITWWGIFNEPNINGLSASDYTTLYNLVVPTMQAAGSAVPLKFAAVELSDFGNEPQNYLPTFVSGVKAQVDAVATHYYSSCNQTDPDAMLLDSISSLFALHVQVIYSKLKANPALASVPVWVTENNVNADFDNGTGFSTCNPAQRFVLDARGTSAFFAAWRPFVFSQLGQAGARSLYHWDFPADMQYGEVDLVTAKKYLSYWVDYTLERMFPSPPGSDILALSTTESTSVEVLATRNADGSVVVMVANHAVHAATDNDGAGDSRTVIVDLLALGSFTSASQTTLDSNTDLTNGPTPMNVAPASRMPITLGGYGVSFLTLKP